MPCDYQSSHFTHFASPLPLARMHLPFATGNAVEQASSVGAGAHPEPLSDLGAHRPGAHAGDGHVRCRVARSRAHQRGASGLVKIGRALQRREDGHLAVNAGLLC